ncbi:MAG: hypothetical protein P1U83_16760 [Roseovarius sp.]|nr:hypothetical protein [Roseovarius sp.]
MDFAFLHTAEKCPAIFDQALTEIGADFRLGYHVEVSQLFGADVVQADEACVESVVLPRASMRVAERGLAGTGFPFYDSPFLVDQQGLDIDRANSTKTEGTI